MNEPIPIPEPRLLHPDELDLPPDDQDSYSRAELAVVRESLEKLAEYARTMWLDLDAVRRYLLQSLPPDPRTPGPVVVSASPTGPDDEDGWERWAAAYAEVTSVLAGPHGDSGFGRGEARREAQIRRSAPVSRVEAQLFERHGLGPVHQAPPTRRWTLAKVAAVAAATMVGERLTARQLRRLSRRRGKGAAPAHPRART